MYHELQIDATQINLVSFSKATSDLNFFLLRAGLENLPIELQRNFTLMRDLDSRAQELMKQIDKLGDDYLSNVKIFGAEKRKEYMNEIQKLFNKAREYGDDKVQLAIQTYELVSSQM